MSGWVTASGDNEVDQLLRITEMLGSPPMALVSQSTKRNIFFEPHSNRPRIVPNLHGLLLALDEYSLSVLGYRETEEAWYSDTGSFAPDYGCSVPELCTRVYCVAP